MQLHVLARSNNLLFHFCADIAYILKMKWFNLIVRANFLTDFQRIKLNTNELKQKTSLYKHFLSHLSHVEDHSLVVLQLIQKKYLVRERRFPFSFKYASILDRVSSIFSPAQKALMKHWSWGIVALRQIFWDSVQSPVQADEL